MIEIVNAGPLIASTTFWDTGYAAAGKMYLSVNAGAFRLLLPKQWAGALPEMATARVVRVIRGPAERIGKADAIRIMFDDASDSPYQIDLSLEQCDRLPLARDVGRRLEFTAWTAPRHQAPHEALRRPAMYLDHRV